jgi:hypothetical protein
MQYNFYVNDRHWGRMFVRLSPYFPFSARVCLNQRTPEGDIRVAPLQMVCPENVIGSSLLARRSSSWLEYGEIWVPDTNSR